MIEIYRNSGLAFAASSEIFEEQLLNNFHQSWSEAKCVASSTLQSKKAEPYLARKLSETYEVPATSMCNTHSENCANLLVSRNITRIQSDNKNLITTSIQVGNNPNREAKKFEFKFWSEQFDEQNKELLIDNKTDVKVVSHKLTIPNNSSGNPQLKSLENNVKKALFDCPMEGRFQTNYRDDGYTEAFFHHAN